LSAAAPAFPGAAPPFPIRNVCKTPLSYFQELLEHYNYTEIKLIGAVLVYTIGRGETWSEITDEMFEEATGVSDEWWRDTLEGMIRYKLIRTKKGERGRPMYALTEKLTAETQAKKIRGKCRACNEIGTFETEFIPVPHAVFKKLGACIDHASYACLLVIIRHGLKWTKERGVWAEPVELDLNDFQRLTGLERRQITDALSKICNPNKWGLVVRTERKGKPAIYRAVPERFGKIERREARVVVMPERRERSGNTTSKGERKKAPNSEKSNAVESESAYYAFCRSCGVYGAVDACEDEPAVNSTPGTPPRAGPLRETGKKKGKIHDTLDELRRSYAGK
jgi:hypothetical protein